MDQFQLAIAIMAAADTRWGSRDADGRRREFTAAELDALADFPWHWPDLKGTLAARANAVRSLWQPRASSSVAPPRLPPAGLAPRALAGAQDTLAAPRARD